jgi:hypothetical protein
MALSGCYRSSTLRDLLGRSMMAAMRGRVLLWTGAGIAVAALAGLGFHLAGVGWDEADKRASVIGLFVAVAGLWVAVYALIADRRGGGGQHPSPTTAQPERPPVDTEKSGATDVGAAGPIQMQNIIASAPGAIAQGAFSGNVINHGGAPAAGLPPSPESSADRQTPEERG